MTIEAITAILALIEQLIPLLGSSGNAQIINTIITALEKFLPLVVNLFPVLYQTAKNILANLMGSTDVPHQLAALQSLDANVDAAFEAAAKDVDPDAVPTV
jgi:hypothetical protein